MSEHTVGCWLADKECIATVDGIHLTDGIPMFCTECGRECICDKLNAAEQRGYARGNDLGRLIESVVYAGRDYASGYTEGACKGWDMCLQAIKEQFGEDYTIANSNSGWHLSRTALEELTNALEDAEVLTDPDLHESIEQMRRGEGEIVRPRPSTPEEGSQYRSAWTLEQEDGTLLTLYGAVNTDLAEVTAEIVEVRELFYVVDAWVEHSKWERL